MTPAAAGVTRELADWIAGLRYQDLPAEVVDQAKGLVLDFFKACAIGAATPWGSAVRELGCRLGSRGQSTVLVFGDRFDPARAALVNGSFAHSADIDDTHVGSMLHPGAAILPAVLALAEDRGAGGCDVIAALIAGYETGIRLSLAMQPSHFQRGFQATGTCGTFGAAAAAASLLGLDAAAVAGALGTAGSSAGGLAQFYYSGSSVKRIHAGRAAEAGVMAGLYAEAGVTGPDDVIEGQAGFAHAYADSFEPERVRHNLGREFKLGEITIKPHGTSARLQATVQALQELARHESIDPAGVISVEVAIPSVIAGRLTQPDPPDVTAAQMSLPFTVGLAIVKSSQLGPDDPLAVNDYERYIRDEQVRRIARVTECRVDAEIDAATTDELVPSRVTLHFADGSQRSRFVARAKGAPGESLSFAECAALLRAAAQDAVPLERIDAVIAGVLGLERLDQAGGVVCQFVR